MPTSRSTTATPSSPVALACLRAAMVRRNRINALATSRLVAWKRRSSLLCALVNSEPTYFSNMASVASAESGFKVGSLSDEDGCPSRRLEIGDVLRGDDDAPSTSRARRAAWICRSARADPEIAHVFEPVEQRDDVGGRRRFRISRNQAKRERRTSGSTRSNLSMASRAASVRPFARVSKAFFRARARAANPILSKTAAAGMSTLAPRRRSSIAWMIGSPRSVGHAASVPTRKHARRSANPKLRRAKSSEIGSMLPARRPDARTHRTAPGRPQSGSQ